MMKVLWDKEDPLRRMPGETVRASQGLKDYANLGLTRSLTKLIQIYIERATSGSIPPTKHRTVLAGWSRRFFWQERVAAWHLLTQEEVEARGLAQFEAMQQRVLKLGEALMQRAEEMVKWPLERTEETETADGKTKIVRVYPAKWDFSTPAQFVKVTHDLFALINGKPTWRGKIDGIEKMTDEQIRDYLVQLARGGPEAVSKSLEGSATQGNESDGDPENPSGTGTVH